MSFNLFCMFFLMDLKCTKGPNSLTDMTTLSHFGTETSWKCTSRVCTSAKGKQVTYKIGEKPSEMFLSELNPLQMPFCTEAKQFRILHKDSPYRMNQQSFLYHRLKLRLVVFSLCRRYWHWKETEKYVRYRTW